MKQAGPRSTRIPQKNRGKSTRIFNFADTLLEKLPPQAASQYHEQPGGRNGNRETSCSQRKSPQLIEYQVYPVRGLSGATPAEPRWTPDFIATPNRVIMFEPQQSANRQKQRRTQENTVSAIFWPVHAAMSLQSQPRPVTGRWQLHPCAGCLFLSRHAIIEAADAPTCARNANYERRHVGRPL